MIFLNLRTIAGVMKSLLSVFVVLILFQTLTLGSLVKIDIQPDEASGVQGSLIHKAIVLDPFLLPDNTMIHPSPAAKAGWLPFNFASRIFSVNALQLLPYRKILSGVVVVQVVTHIPVFILNSILRL